MSDEASGASLWQSVRQVVDQALGAVGVLAALLALAVFGAVMAAAVDLRWLLLAFLGGFGALEAAHIRAVTHLRQRRKYVGDSRLMFDIANKNPSWNPEVLNEFIHGGVCFRATGFDKLKIPLAVAGPLCPACKAHLTERREARFPLRTRIEFLCQCGFRQRSPHTLGELREEAEELAGIPR